MKKASPDFKILRREVIRASLIVTTFAAATALADFGTQFPADPFTPGNCWSGSGTTTPPSIYGTGSLKYLCEHDDSYDDRCEYNTRKACEVLCDDHCALCFARGDGNYAHWTTGPICVGNCVVDNSADTCTGCPGTTQMICAVGDIYTEQTCTTPHSPAWVCWDLHGGQRPCAP